MNATPKATPGANLKNVITLLAERGAMSAETAIPASQINWPGQANKHSGASAAGYLCIEKKFLGRYMKEGEFYYWMTKPLKVIEQKINKRQGGGVRYHRDSKAGREQTSAASEGTYTIRIEGPDLLLERKLDRRSLSKIMSVLI